MWWLGAYADGKLGPVNINFDFVYDTGNVKNRLSAQKVNYEGCATRLKIDFPWEAFNFGGRRRLRVRWRYPEVEQQWTSGSACC